MSKKAKRIAAIAALLAIAAFLIYFIASAILATPDEAGNRFMALLSGIIGLPLLAWLLLFCIGRMRQKKTAAEPFPEGDEVNQ
ncbi:MAG: hypothetical protein NC337_04320 [Roseburia sp.]|nr:hypothetical protein [Roseburia sp.]